MNRIKGTWSKLAITALGCLALAAVAAPSASAKLEFSDIGVDLKEKNGTHSRQAGAHPDFSFKFAFAPGATESARDIELDLPVGMLGNPAPFPTCGLRQFGYSAGQNCPAETQVGLVHLITAERNVFVPLNNLERGPDVPALFGFKYNAAAGFIVPRVRPDDYGISAGSLQITQAETIKSVTVTYWGVPADPSHDRERYVIGDGDVGHEEPNGDRIFNRTIISPLRRFSFWTNPTACPDKAASFEARGDSWQFPGVFDVRPIVADMGGTPFVWEGCENLIFDPTMTPLPGTHRAHSPSGLDVRIHVPSSDETRGFSASAVKKTVIEFPKGMTVSPSAVAGLEACSEAQVGLGNNNPPTCPSGAKIGNITIDSQLLNERLEGEVVLAKQKENPFHSTYAIYLLVKGPGFYLKLPGEMNLDQKTGQLRVIFDDLPQLPFEDVHLDLRGGPTAPLVTPNKCGDYSIRTEVFPWARPNSPVVASVPMPINEDCAGGGEFKPTLQAGVANPVAGALSPLTIRVKRQDGEQNISRLEVTLPEGELAKLKGTGICPEAAAASASCPNNSQVGIATTALGTGAFPLFTPQPGKSPTALYLAGPYKGAPYSLITKVPAQAGPFDFGNIVVRTAIDLDPVTTQVVAKSDPLPQILEGVPIAYRDVRIEVQKPDFTVNPTSCEERRITTNIYSIDGAVAHPSVPTKVGDCGALNFGPKLAFRVKGGTNRGDLQQFTAVLTTGKKEANIDSVQVTLPHSEFLEQSNIRTVCTRVQFAQDKCPEASIYGTAEAVTPLLDEPLRGPVYLRSSNHSLPDLVAALNGQFDVELAGRIDSKNGGIRNTFEVVPDAPVSKFVLKMQGGKKSLLVNSRNLCKAPSRADVKMVGQNGKTHSERPIVKNSCSKAELRKARNAKKRAAKARANRKG